MTAPASAPALRIFAGTTEGRLLCEWASEAGIPAQDVRGKLNELAAQAMGDGCTPANPVAPTHDDLVAILRQVL